MGQKSSNPQQAVAQPLPSGPRLGVDANAQAQYQKRLDDYYRELAAFEKAQNSPMTLPRSSPKSSATDMQRPEMPTPPRAKTAQDLIAETSINVDPEVLARLRGAVLNPQDYSDALFEQSMQMIQPEMSARGLPVGSEINDAARARAAMDAILGGQQMQARDVATTAGGLGALTEAERASMGDVMGSYGLEFQTQLPAYLQEVNRQNLIYGNEAANARQASQNRSSKKGSTLGAASNLGVAAIGV